MKAVLPPLITIILIASAIIFLNIAPIGHEWLKSEADFDILSPLFLIRNGILIVLGIIFTFVFGGGFLWKEEFKSEVKVLLPIVAGLGGGGLLILLVGPVMYPKGNIFLNILFILIWAISEEIYFRSFLTRSLIKLSNPTAVNVIALLISAILYSAWCLTYFPVVTSYNFIENLAIGILFFFAVALPTTASFCYSRSIISSTITNFVIKVLFIGYCVIVSLG